ncbi:MAG: class I SAM-dependent methyltransferase [Pseudomonadaceae bacterium]
MKDAKTFWDRSAGRYARSPIKDEASYQRKLELTRECFSSDCQVLEFGCGTGGTALAHAPWVGSYIASDISTSMLDIGRQRAAEEGVENLRFAEGDLLELSFADSSFDVVLGLNVLHLIEPLQETLECVHRLLKPGGAFVSSTALVAEISWVWRCAIPLMQWIGLAPFVQRLDRAGLEQRLSAAGFVVEQCWQPPGGALFVVARKPAQQPG